MLDRRRAALSLPLWTLFAACPGDPAASGTSADASGTSSPGTGDPGGTTEGPTPTTGAPTSTTADPTTSTSGESTATGDEPTTATTDETTGGGAREGGISQRPAAPIVLVGGQVPGMSEVAAGDIVGFASVAGEWKQVPVQVDERVRVDFCTIYAKALLGEAKAPCATTKIIDALFYADPGTYTGPDSDPDFDLDDELVFMARDAGDRVARGSEPADVVAGSGVEVEVRAGDETGWVYLFARSEGGGLEPGAGVDLVGYTLKFTEDIDYLTQYPFVGKGSCGEAVCDPPILEDSVISSEHYERHFSARWVTDALRLTTPGSTGEDVLDIAQARFAPGFCGRHVLTFSTSEGAFIANIDGPVRAIRSYMGANSGPLTQRTHLFYDRVEEIDTFLRVHQIPAIMELIDYASEADGMTYYNEHNEGGLAIDGEPDPGFDTTAFKWELVSGPHGSIVSTIDANLSKPLKYVGYFEDDAMTPNDQCSASNVLDHPDDQAFGTSGLWIVDPIPDTDPRNGSLEHVFINRTSYYEAADLELAAAKQLVALAADPPQALARSLAGAPGLACGDAECGADEAMMCPFDCNPFAGTCDDGLCDLWENSVSCAEDCGTGMIGTGCGDQTCDPGEHELNCGEDCWEPVFAPLLTCLGQSCGVELGACSDELPCVDRTVCTVECVAGGGAAATCANMCNMQIPATTEQASFAAELLACAQQFCV